MISLTDRDPRAALFRLPGRVVTAGQFAADAARLAAALPGGGFAVNLCTGRYAFAVGFAAALMRGQVSLLASDRSAPALQALAGQFPSAAAIVDAGGAAPWPSVHVPPPGEHAAAVPAIAADQVAARVFTSGSTGTPVAHDKTWGALVARTQDAADAFALQDEEPAAVVGTVPPQHMYGFEATVLLPLHAPAVSWCGPAFYPADVRDALAALAPPRVLVTTPLQLRSLLPAPGLPPVARVISATAPLDPVMAEAVERQWQTLVSEIFGATEVGSIAFRRTLEGPDWTPYRSVALVRDGDGVCVHAPGAAATVLDDRVALQPDGRFRLLGRRSDLVKLGGRRASLSGLNRALAAVEGVEDGVFLPPGPGEDHAGARMTALVVAPGRAGEAILAALRTQIDPVFLPRRIVHVERLPRNALGKLPAGALRALAEAP